MTKILKVFGFEIDPKVCPKLYKLGEDNLARLELMITLAKDHCLGLTTEAVVNKIEAAEGVTVMGKKIDVFEFPAIYCWYSQNPLGFKKFYNETIAALWGEDQEMAFKMMEEYFERGVK